jgi:hypothetical protein
MPDVVAVYVLYPHADPRAVLESVAASLAAGREEVAVEGPRERFGTVECRLSVDAPGGPLSVAVEAVPADARTHAKPAVPALELDVTADEFEYGDRGDQALVLLDLVEAIYAATDDPPALTYGFDAFHLAGVGEDLRVPVTERGLSAGELADVCWLTVFTPPFVDAHGEHVLRTAPVWHRDWVADGALALVSTPDPSDPDDVDHDPLREHLGLEPHGSGT